MIYRLYITDKNFFSSVVYGVPYYVVGTPYSESDLYNLTVVDIFEDKDEDIKELDEVRTEVSSDTVFVNYKMYYLENVVISEVDSYTRTVYIDELPLNLYT